MSEIMRADPPPVEPIAFRVNDAAAAAGLCRSSLYEAIRLGELRSVKRCGRRLIMRADLEAFLLGGLALVS